MRHDGMIHACMKLGPNSTLLVESVKCEKYLRSPKVSGGHQCQVATAVALSSLIYSYFLLQGAISVNIPRNASDGRVSGGSWADLGQFPYQVCGSLPGTWSKNAFKKTGASPGSSGL